MAGIDGEIAGGRRAERAQSSVVGVVLVVAITVIGVSGVLVFGTGALGDARTQSEIDAAEHAMTQLDSRFSLVALGAATSHGSSVTLGSGSDMRVRGDAGWMNVSVMNRTTGTLETEVLNESLGAVIYENDGTTIAYQGGGVWKRSSGGSVMVSPPEFHYRTRGGEDPTLTLPIVLVRGGGSLGEDATVSKDATVEKYPVTGDPARSNPLGEGEIDVTVHSEYYRGWGSFFEERTRGTVSYDHAAETVTITLVVEQTTPSIQGGIVSGASSSTLEFENQASADSYNSSSGPYASSGAQNTTIVSAGDVDLGNKALIEGNLVTGGTAELSNNAHITGNLTYGGSPPSNPGAVDGEVEPGADVTQPAAVDWLIDERLSALEDSNGNAGASDVDDSTDSLQNCGGGSPCTLSAGSYYLDEMNLGSGDELLVDTSGGDVEVAVDGDVTLTQDAKVHTTSGGGTVRFYVDGNLYLRNQANVSVPDDRSPRLWFYTKPGRTAVVRNDARLVGVVYGPGNGAQDGTSIQLKNQIDVYGGLVGSVDTVKNGMGIHFDEALADEDPLGGYAGGQPTVTYMHVTVNRVNVSSG